MTLVHMVRVLYLTISAAVAFTAEFRALKETGSRRVEGFTFAGFALSTAAAQGYAYDKPITLGTAFVGFGVLIGMLWLLSLIFRKGAA